MGKKSWERKECVGCKLYNPECQLGVCSIYPYKKKKIVSEKEIEDTS